MDRELNIFSTEELITLAIAAENKEIAWNYIGVLQFRGDREVFDAAKQLCESKCYREKLIGIDILAQLGIPDRTFPKESLEICLNLLNKEQNTNVLRAVGIALGHLQDIRCIEPLIKFKNHPNADVRFGIVCGLLCLEHFSAINTLIELSSDPDDEVRNWATFGLGSLIDTDTEAIREALFQRFLNEDTEENYEIYGEALVGLAKRKDEQILSALIKELNSNLVGNLAIEAAEEMNDSRLYPALIKLNNWWNGDKHLLERAIENCQKRNINE